MFTDCFDISIKQGCNLLTVQPNGFIFNSYFQPDGFIGLVHNDLASAWFNVVHTIIFKFDNVLMAQG